MDKGKDPLRSLSVIENKNMSKNVQSYQNIKQWLQKKNINTLIIKKIILQSCIVTIKT